MPLGRDGEPVDHLGAGSQVKQSTTGVIVAHIAFDQGAGGQVGVVDTKKNPLINAAVDIDLTAAVRGDGDIAVSADVRCQSQGVALQGKIAGTGNDGGGVSSKADLTLAVDDRDSIGGGGLRCGIPLEGFGVCGITGSGNLLPGGERLSPQGNFHEETAILGKDFLTDLRTTGTVANLGRKDAILIWYDLACGGAI